MLEMVIEPGQAWLAAQPDLALGDGIDASFVDVPSDLSSGRVVQA